MIFTTLIALLSPAFAGDFVFSSYCSAALEAQSSVTPETFAVMESTLSALAERLERANEIWNLPDVTPGSLLYPARRRFELSLGLENSPRMGRNRFDLSREFVRLRSHFDQLTTDVLSIQDGMVSGVSLIRGREAILAYFEDVSRRAQRNEDVFQEGASRAMPYVNRLRVTLRGLQAGTVVSLFGLYATSFAFIKSPLGYSAQDWIESAINAPFNLYLGSLLLPGAIYPAGLVNKKVARVYEKLYGTRQSVRRVERFERVSEIIRNREYTDQTLSYQSSLNTLSETDRFDLKTAVDANLPPTERYYVSQENDGLTPPADPTWKYVLALDQAFFVHEGEPTLLFVHRIVRGHGARKKPRKTREPEKEKSWLPGSPLPQGA